MKVAFAIDFLIERNPEVFLLELMLAGFPEAEIYCLVHIPGKILGRIETHRIHSSPLSRMVKSKKDLEERAWMLPGAAKQIQVSPDVDKLVILTSGWAHTIKSSARTERFCWVYDFFPKNLALKGWRTIFNFHHKDFTLKALEAEKNLSFSSETLAKKLNHSGAQVIRPGFKTEDHPLVPDEQHPGVYTHHLVLLDGADPKEVRELFQIAKRADVHIKCVGIDDEYAVEKSLPKEEIDFIGDHCAATTAAFTHGARAVWILKERPFLNEALGALCCGRPVVVKENDYNREILPSDGAWFINSSLQSVFDLANRDYLSADKKVLRRSGLKFNERLFKNQIRAWAAIKPLKLEE
ncbi:MAG: hypothetical protein K2P81_02700 [Bacteriovoracaceae bacterium]|nr:hypothetical protein [Bacteriovoracaceae bacterium]